MKISVIVPTYKPQAYLWECLDSIYNQTFPKSDYEVLLVLNGCNEPYNAQITEWLSKHSDLQVQYFQTDEGGVSNARNIALNNAKGEYITFIEDDDYISSSYLETLLEHADKDTISAAYPYAFKNAEPNKQIPYSYTKFYNIYEHKGKLKAKYVRQYFSGPCMKLFHRSIINNKRFNPKFRIGEDSLFMFLISDKFKYFQVMSKNAVYYRRYRMNSAVTTKRSSKEVVGNSLKLLYEYSSIYFKAPFSYSIVQYLRCVVGTLHSILNNLDFLKEKGEYL